MKLRRYAVTVTVGSSDFPTPSTSPSSQGTKTMKKLNKLTQTPILPILGVIFLLISLLLSRTTSTKIPKPVITPTKAIVIPITVTSTVSPIKNSKLEKPQTVTVTVAKTNNQSANIQSPSPTGIKPTAVPDNKLKVNLTVNGSGAFPVEVSSGANQCDVLSQALAIGKIQSLNMRFNSDMGTYAVYQINGIGKDNSVWWTYKVNGQSPQQGCSYVKVNNGDNSEWSYIGN